MSSLKDAVRSQAQRMLSRIDSEAQAANLPLNSPEPRLARTLFQSPEPVERVHDESAEPPSVVAESSPEVQAAFGETQSDESRPQSGESRPAGPAGPIRGRLMEHLIPAPPELRPLASNEFMASDEEENGVNERPVMKRPSSGNHKMENQKKLKATAKGVCKRPSANVAKNDGADSAEPGTAEEVPNGGGQSAAAADGGRTAAVKRPSAQKVPAPDSTVLNSSAGTDSGAKKPRKELTMADWPWVDVADSDSRVLEMGDWKVWACGV